MTENEQNIEVMKDLRNRLDAVINKDATATSDTQKYPDAKKHMYVSFVKSAFRIAAGFSLAFGYFQAAGLLLVLAEVLGIAEEVV
jgi:hypothetical protein